jgi:hypothetical protein
MEGNIWRTGTCTGSIEMRSLVTQELLRSGHADVVYSGRLKKHKLLHFLGPVSGKYHMVTLGSTQLCSGSGHLLHKMSC